MALAFFFLLLALLINRKGIKLKKLYRTLFVATIAVPQFVSLLIMSKMLDTGGGILGSGGTSKTAAAVAGKEQQPDQGVAAGAVKG